MELTLNIKDPTAYTLAQILAKETGETMTHAVTEAIRERLERIRRQRKPEATVAELLAIGRRCASTLKGKPVDHAAMLYDQKTKAADSSTPFSGAPESPSKL